MTRTFDDASSMLPPRYIAYEAARVRRDFIDAMLRVEYDDRCLPMMLMPPPR